MSFFLGIDGGGSKTECVLADAAGAVLARARGGGTNLRRVPPARLHATLADCLEQLRRTAGLATLVPEAVCAGFAGAAHTAERVLARDVLSALLRPRFLYVVGDMEVALEAAVGAGRGVVLVAGTGTIAYGRNELGRQARAGGRGPLVDEGSGFDIGRRAVEAVRAERPPTTKLTSLVLEALQVDRVDQLEARVSPHAAVELAALVPRVVEAAKAGGGPAGEILEQAGTALARLALTVLRELGLLEAEVQVATCGGVFTASAEVFARVREEVRSAAPRAVLEPLRVAPAEGAVRLAQRLWLQERATAPA